MTPLEISICLHYHAHCDDHPWIALKAPILPDALLTMQDARLLERERDPKAKRQWKPTEKLHAFVEMLCAIPLPAQSWCDPRTNTVVARVNP